MISCSVAKLLWFLSIIVFVTTITENAGQHPSCLKNLVWEKVKGMRPESVKEINLLYRGIDSQGIVVACFEKCKSTNCSAFIVNLEKSYCFSVELRNNSSDFLPEPNVTFYHKICLKVPEYCLKNNYWQVERSLGSILFDTMAVKLSPEIVSRADCYEACLNQEKTCKAAQFQASRDLYVNDTLGTCTLLTVEREMKPQSYRVSLYRDEYLENQCHEISKTDFCSYAEYQDMLMPYSDAKVVGLNEKQCEKRCDLSKDGFLCRAFGLETINNNHSICYLYSEDTISSGISSLVSMSNSTYKEREPCVNMSVHCTNTSLVVKLSTREPFNGKLYSSDSFDKNCSVQGNGSNITILSLPYPNLKNINDNSSACGLTFSNSSDHGNRTYMVVWSTVIIQFNPIIQRLGDQAIKVGCSFSNDSTPMPQNISVNSGFTFVDPNAGLPPIVNKVVNTSSIVPAVSMNILDETLKPANVTHLGQKLLLKIKMSPDQGPFDFTAGNLIASSYNGDASLLLLDEHGCPTSEIFPSFTRDSLDNRSLVAEFNAFKFPNSQYVRFNVIVEFCLEICKSVGCKNDSMIFGREKRLTYNLYAGDGNSSSNNSIGNETLNKEDDEKLPLQKTIMVKDSRESSSGAGDNIVPNRLKHNPDTFVVFDPDRMDSQFCMDANLILFLLTILLVVQIILIGSCIFAIRNYRRLAVRAEEDRADILARHLYGIHGGNFEISRRVRWIDDGSTSLS